MVSQKQQLYQPTKEQTDTLETTIIHLLKKVLRWFEIVDRKMYGHHYTPQTMSNMTKVLTEEVNAFKSRAPMISVAIFMDATYDSTKTSNRIQRSDLYCYWYTRRRH